jgi:hypothetical protein
MLVEVLLHDGAASGAPILPLKLRSREFSLFLGGCGFFNPKEHNPNQPPIVAEEQNLNLDREDCG